ncbi:hypothetical protein COO60DRAFT_1671934 [Scenedesmus sp. NREL 46B-D3]|nr:hypothetical protein COO60DRAFT_1671934 [Scenedesmus sp. NREL 46B-D3]
MEPDAQHQAVGAAVLTEEEPAAAAAPEQPKAKRRISRLQHMTVHKAAESPVKDQELPHKSSPAAKAGFSLPTSLARDADMEDQADDVELAAAHPTSTAAAEAQAAATGVEEAAPEEAVTEAAAAAAESQQQQQQHQKQQQQQPVQLQETNLDDDDDDWEDQPAPYTSLPEDSAAQGDAEVAAGSQTSGGTAAEGEQQDEQAQQDSASGGGSVSGSGQEGDEAGHGSLADDADASNAQTQRLLREAAAKDGLGKGFKPEVAPLNSILGKLAARQAALEAKTRHHAAATAAAAAADDGAHPALTFENLKAHLERHNLGQRQQQPDPAAQQAAATPATAVAADDGSGPAAAAAAEAEASADVDIADMPGSDGLEDELVVEPPQQQQAGDGASWLLPETQQMLEGLPGAVAGAGAGALLAGTEAPADELDLQLEDAAEDEEQHGSQAEDAAGPASEGEDEDVGDASGSGDESEDEDAAGSGSDDEELHDSSEIEDEQQESEPAAELLHWEEEEEEVAGSGSQQQASGEGAAAAKKAKKSAARARRAAGGFIEAEADLSDGEGGQGGSDDEYDDDDDDDPELAAMIAEYKEGRMDEVRRAALHAEYEETRDAKDVAMFLDALKRGYRRKRRQGLAGLDDEDDGTDAAARRRRAQLLGITQGDEAEVDHEAAAGSDRLARLDFQLTEQEGDLAAAEAAAAAELANREKQKLIRSCRPASHSRCEGDVMQLLQLDVDDDSQHTAALLSRSASAAAPLNTTAAANRAGSLGLSAGQRDVSGSHSLRAQAAAGATKQAGAAAAAGAAGTGAAGFSFQVFGKDLTNSSKPQQAAGSFIGRQASQSVTVRAASNYGASRSFVFGSDPSNYSNPGAGNTQQQQQQQQDSRQGAGSVGPSSFAGLSKLISEAAAKEPGRPAQQVAAVGGRAVQQQKKSIAGAGVLESSTLKQHVAAVGAKFKAASSNNSKKDDATSRGAWEY